MKMTRLWGIAFWMFLGIFSATAQVKFEAENGTLSLGTGGAAGVIASDASVSGGKYIQLNTSNFALSITVAEAGFYNLYIRMASPGGVKPNYFLIDGNSATFSQEMTSVYANVKVASFCKLAAGTHTVGVNASWGYINIDYIEMVKVDASSRFNIAPKLTTPNPTPEATALYDFLKDNYGQKIISGVMTLNSMDMVQTVKSITSEEPALLGIDFMQCNAGNTWYNDATPKLDAETYYNRNGIPAFTWHWRDPLKKDGTGEFYTKSTTFDIRKVEDPNSAEYKAMIKDIDFIADQFLYLQSKNVAVVWRPLHEAAGGWFWWGAHGGKYCKELWQLMYDRMVNVKGVRNCIWVWTYEPQEDGTWYPGDDYVDIIGRDIYDTGNHTSKVIEFNNISSMHNGTKMVAETECGSFPDPDLLQADGAAWSWFMPWYETSESIDKFITDPKYNTEALWKKTMSHEYVIVLDEMPNLRTYTSAAANDATLKGIKLSAGTLSPAFAPTTSSYTVLLSEESAIPTVTATTTHFNAKASVTNPVAIPGTATISVTSADGTTTGSYTIKYETYTPVATKVTVAPDLKTVIASEKLNLTAQILDQYGAPMNKSVTWTASTGTIVPTANTAVFTAPITAGDATVTATFGTLSSNVYITVVEGFIAPVPTAANWIGVNEWSQAVTLTNTASALSVGYIAWGYGLVDLINVGDEISVENGVEYDIIIDYQGAPSSGAASLVAGFADTWSTKAVTALNSTKSTISTGLSGTEFTTQVFTVTANVTGKTNLFIQMSWGADPSNDKPKVTTTSFIKNIKVIAKKSNPQQRLVLDKGWNLVSTYIQTSDMSIPTVMSCATTVKNDSDFYGSTQPDYLNGITAIEAGKGYLVYSPVGCTKLLEGTVSYASTEKLTKGWNIIGYPFNTTKDIETVISSIQTKTISVKDFEGFWINGGINSFTQMSPGKAYFINVSEDCTITW